MWAPTLVWVIALAVLILLVLLRGARSERRIMLALLCPVLPFSLPYSTFAPRPELYGMTAVLAFGVSLSSTRTARARFILSGLYGIVLAALALMHEATPIQFALGAVLSIAVLAKGATCAVRRICAVLAIGPGFVTTFLIVRLGRRDVAPQLCDQLPHRMVKNPYVDSISAQTATRYLLGRGGSRSDYHDFVCAVIKQLDLDFTDAVRSVMHVGFIPLFASFLLGLLIFVATTWAIGYFSGVPVRAFLGELHGRSVLPVLAVASMMPLFMAGCDWTRWWVLITFDVAIVYIQFAIDRPEIEQAPSRRTVRVFVAVLIVLAIPTGQTGHVGGPAFPTAGAAAVHKLIG
jgi:hypothetical protein